MEASKTMSSPQNNRWRTQKSKPKIFHMCEECAHWWDHHLDAPHGFKQKHQQRRKETGWASTTPCQSPGKKGHELQIRRQKSSHACEHWKLHSWRARHSNSSHGCRKLKFKQKHQHRSKHNGWNSTTPRRSPWKMEMNPNFDTENPPTCVSTENCLHWWAHHFDFPQGCHELYFHHNNSKNININNRLFRTYTPSCLNSPASALWDPIQRGKTIVSSWQFQNLLWGPIMCDLIGDMANYLKLPTTGKWNGIFGGPNQVSTDSSGQKDRDSWRKVRVAFTTP